MFHALPCDVGDVQQPIETSKVDERTIVSKVLDHPFYDLTFLEILKQGAALFLHLLLNDGSPGDDHVVPTLVEFDNLKLQFPVLQMRRVSDRPDISEGAWEKCPHFIQRYGKAPFYLTR